MATRMPEPPTNPPRVHLVSCLYVVTALLVIYWISLRLYLPESIPYLVSSETILITPFAHTAYFYGIILAAACLAISYSVKNLSFTLLSGLSGIVLAFGLLSIFFQEASWVMKANNYGHIFYEHAFAARVISDLSYYPCKYCVLLISMNMFLRLFDYRPTTFRLTLLDMMLITVAVAVILGTRGLAMKVYGLA